MSFNPSKYQAIHVTLRKTPLQTKYPLHGCVLESVPFVKYLGVSISEDLKLTEHTKNYHQKGKSNTRISQTQHSGPQQGLEKPLSAHS